MHLVTLAQAEPAPAGVTPDPALFSRVAETLWVYWPILAGAFLVSLIFTPIMRTLAIANGVVDRPDEARKIHKKPIAYLGGMAIFLGWMAGILIAFLIPNHVGSSNTIFPVSIVLGGIAIVLTGLFDDVWGISPRVKVGGQLFAAAALASEDVGVLFVEQSIRTVQRYVPTALPDTLYAWLTAPAPDVVVYCLGTIVIGVFVLGACNAMNLIDGMDGLASGTTGICAIGFMLMAGIIAVLAPVQTADPIRIVMALAILGGVLGFLPYNYNPASIFMGDAGSLLLGYLCITNILLFAYAGHGSEGPALLYVTACLIVFAFPITDTSLAIFRRKMAGKPLMSPDDQHIHHILKRSGLSVRKAVGIMWAGSVVFAALGVAMIAFQLQFRYLFAAALMMYAIIFIAAYSYGKKQAARALANQPQPEPDAETPASTTPADPPRATPPA